MRAWAQTGEGLSEVYLGHRSPHPHRPWVLANMVAGIDGCTAINGRVGQLSGRADQEMFRRLRQVADVVLVGAGTVRAERYGRVKLTGEEVSLRASRGQHPVPTTAVISRTIAFDWDIPVFQTDHEHHRRPLIITSHAADTSALTEARRHADVLIAGDDDVDLTAALGQLHQAGVGTVLAEGGARSLGALAAAGLLDELCLTLAPIMGGDPLPVAVWPREAGAAAYRLDSVGSDDGHLFLRYLKEQAA